MFGFLPTPFIALILLLALFLAVVGAVNLWVKHRTWHDDQYIVHQIYTRRRLFWLYVKCWVVLVAGVTLLTCVEMELLMQLLVILLVLLATVGIVYGESLAEVRLLQSQSENLMLRSQLNPHFLYNTLNNIDALIWLDQEKASAAVTNLSDLMRYFTYSARQDSVSLADEISHLTQLVELQRLRMPVPESLTFAVQIGTSHDEIAPLLLLPLIENCFKHCGNLNERGAIRLQITVADGWLDYRSDNNVPDEAGALANVHHPHGVGMKVLRQRLNLLYEGNYLLETEQVNGRYLTHLRVKL